MNYRFRAGEGGALVLQVGQYKSNPYAYDNGKLEWRDATIEDIPVNDPFRRDPEQYAECGAIDLQVVR